MRKLHLTNPKQRDATVGMAPVKSDIRPHLALPGEKLEYRRYIGAAESGLHESLVAKLGEDYGQALVDGDPEIDVEYVGQRITRSDRIYLSHGGQVLHHAPEELELILAPDGTERERRPPKVVIANVNEDVPARWTGKKIPKGDVVRRFVLTRTVALQHVDGLTFDFLYGMAKELHESGTMMLMGGGESGKEPLILIPNGSPYRGLLEGRIDGERYMLLLHLSNMELKLPKKAEE